MSPITFHARRVLIGTLIFKGCSPPPELFERIAASRRRAFGLRPVLRAESWSFGFNLSCLRAFVPTALRLATLDIVEPAELGRPGLRPPQLAVLVGLRSSLLRQVV